jgi:N-acetylneuraminic acid mutarotase
MTMRTSASAGRVPYRVLAVLACSSALLATLVVTGPAAGAEEPTLRFTFAPAGTPAVAGYVIDSGAAYTEASGYGWIAQTSATPVDATSRTRDRNAVADPLLDSFIHMQPAGATSPPVRWQHALPQGTYDVSVTVGDPSYLDSTHWLRAEDVQVVQAFVPTTSVRSRTSRATVVVDDGFLTLDAVGGTNTKLQDVTITPVPPPVPAGPSVTAVSPQDGAVGVDPAARVSLTLSSPPADDATIADAVLLTGPDGARLPAGVVLDATGTTLLVTPEQPLPYGTAFGVALAEGLLDTTGEPYAAFHSGFTTRSDPALAFVAAPEALDGAGGDAVVGLTWTPSASPNVVGYDIYRSEALPVPVTGTPVNAALVDTNTFINTGRTNGKTYHYVVVAVSDAGNRSEPSPTASVRPQDPAVPTGAPITWAARAATALTRTEAGGALSGGKLYVFGGQFTGTTQTVRSERYDPATNSWAPIRDLPEALTHAPVIADGTKLWILGGNVGVDIRDSSPRVWVYDVLTDTYEAGPPLPAPRGAGAGVLVGRTLHYLSGETRYDSLGIVATDQPDHWTLDLDDPTEWLTSTPVPNPANHVAATALGTTIYLIGGQHGRQESTSPQKTVYALDTVTGEWTRRADLPVPRGHVNASTFVWNGKILSLGGSTVGAKGSATIFEYDPVTDVWTTRTNLPEASRSPVGVLLDGKFLVSGGRLSTGPTAHTWLGTVGTPVPLTSGTWAPGTSLPAALTGAGGAAIGTTVYVVGGKTSAGAVSTVYAYDTVARTWRTRAVLPGSAVESPAVVAYNGRLYAAGGSAKAFSGAVKTLYRYDPPTNKWTRLADMPTAHGSAAAVVSAGGLWVLGGMDGTGASLRTTARYDLAAGTWAAGPQLATARDNPGAAALPGGIYVFGGRTRLASGTEVAPNLASTEVFVPGTSAWQPGPAMLTGRRAMAVGVFDNTLVATGGERQASAAVWPQTEALDATTGTWRALTPLRTPRHHAAAAVVGGRLYVIGGGTKGGDSYSALNEVLTP